MTLNTLATNRDRLLKLDDAQRQEMLSDHCLVTDPRRTRPYWFDGRFLAARDLVNEQNYFLQRQADLGRAGGSGVVDGLLVSETEHATTRAPRLRIEAGFGFADTGEMIVLENALDLDPANIPEIQRLDAAFGLQLIPKEPGRARTGLYVLALRPVEWTARPLAAYPTSLTGERTVHDGDIVAGVAVALIPYPDQGGENWTRRRARVAREIFVSGRDHGFASGTLPLALVALQGNIVIWVDPYLVRREAGAERPAGMDFGFGARALREAQLLQYEHHLAEILRETREKPFEATACFDALPPIGRLPAPAVDATDMTQSFFPPAMTVELSLVPDDELPAVIEESLLLPPLDLHAPAETIAGYAVMILAPLPRAQFAKWYKQLGGRTLKLTAPVRALKSDGRFLAFSLAHLRESSLADQPVDEAVTEATADWKAALVAAQERRLLWYVRRRHLPEEANIAGAAVDATDPKKTDRGGLGDFLRKDPAAYKQWERLQKKDSAPIRGMLEQFAKTDVVENPGLIRSLLAATADESLTDDKIVATLAVVAHPDFGRGVAVLANEDAALDKAFAKDSVAASGTLQEIDTIARAIPPAKRDALIADLKDAMKKPSELTDAVAELRTKYLKVTP